MRKLNFFALLLCLFLLIGCGGQSETADAEDLPEDFLIWARAPLGWKPTEEGTLGLWGIYNISEGSGFVTYPN